jgi:hypothetical protein
VPIATLWLPVFRRRRSAGLTPPTFPPNLISAIIATAALDPALSGVLAWWKDELPPIPKGATAPATYGLVSRAGSTLLWNTVGSVWHSERIRFRVYSLDADTAESLAEALIAAVPAWGSLDYQTGFSIPMFEAGTMSAKNPKRRSGDPGSWYAEVKFEARCKRGRA